MNIQPDIKLDFDDVLIVPRRSTIKSRKDVNLKRTFKFYHSTRSLTCIPIFSANMAFSGPLLAKEMSRLGLLCALHKYVPNDQINSVCSNTLVFMSIGMRDKDYNKLESFIHTYKYVPNLVIDVPNAYIQSFISYCAKVRKLAENAIIIAGNVVTSEMVQELIIHGGVDCVKIGIGPGSHCQTRMKTGVSYPQISACAECSIVAHGLKSNTGLGLVCLDGGFKNSGDLCKGFVAGADFCMTSNLLCGVEESEGEWIDKSYNSSFPTIYDEFLPEGSLTNKSEDSIGGICKISTRKKCFKHYGMSSHYAQEKHGEGRKDYRASEGKVSLVDYKGNTEDVIKEILGGLRSCASYIGSNELRHFNKCGSFIKVNK